MENAESMALEKATYSGYVISENEQTAIETQREVVKALLAKLQESERNNHHTTLLRRNVECGDWRIFRGIGKYGSESAPPRAATSKEGGTHDTRSFREFSHHAKSYGEHHARDFASETRCTV